jgi:hypothetical protein
VRKCYMRTPGGAFEKRPRKRPGRPVQLLCRLGHGLKEGRLPFSET